MRPSSDLPVGVILAGGDSTRMGRDKAHLELGGRTLVERAAAKLSVLLPEVVVADRGRRLTARYDTVQDGAGRGPVAALLGAAARFPGRSLLALACDLPAVPVPLLGALSAEIGWDWVVPLSVGGPEPLCALYSPRALSLLAKRVKNGRFALHELLHEDGLRLRTLDLDELGQYGRPEEMLANANTPEDWSRLRHLLGAIDPSQEVEAVDAGAVPIRKQQ